MKNKIPIFLDTFISEINAHSALTLWFLWQRPVGNLKSCLGKQTGQKWRSGNKVDFFLVSSFWGFTSLIERNFTVIFLLPKFILSVRGLLYQLPHQLSSSCEGFVRRKSVALTERQMSYLGGKRLSTLHFVNSGTLGYALDTGEYYVLLPLLILITLLPLIFFILDLHMGCYFQCPCVRQNNAYTVSLLKKDFLLFPVGHTCTHIKPTKS